MFLTENRRFIMSYSVEIDCRKLKRTMNYSAKCLNDIVQYFLKEYLGELFKNVLKNIHVIRYLKHIVLIVCANKKYLFLPLAKVIKLIHGRYGKICNDI